jgi:hypothetical protein
MPKIQATYTKATAVTITIESLLQMSVFPKTVMTANSDDERKWS